MSHVIGKIIYELPHYSPYPVPVNATGTREGASAGTNIPPRGVHTAVPRSGACHDKL